MHGPQGLNSDLLNRAFEIVRRSKEDYPKLDVETQAICKAFTDGLNYYLKTHATARPRLIQQFKPWHVLAFYRHVQLELSYRYTHLSDSMLPRHNRRIWAQVGSNGWAISGARTKTGNAMLFVNPHMPFYGFGQLYEAHLICKSGSGEKNKRNQFPERVVATRDKAKGGTKFNRLEFHGGYISWSTPFGVGAQRPSWVDPDNQRTRHRRCLAAEVFRPCKASCV